MATTINRADVEAVIQATKKALKLVELQNATFEKANEKVTPTSFDAYPGANVVVTAHTNAHTEATTTLTRVTTTLSTFTTNLQAVLDSMDDVEVLTQSAFDRITAVSEQASSGTSGASGQGPFVLNDEEVKPEKDGAPETTSPEVCAPEGAS